MIEATGADVNVFVDDRAGISLCSCGSGLSHSRCCGLDTRGAAQILADRALDVEIEQINQARRTRDREAVKAAAIAVLECVPGHRDALLTLFYELRDAQSWQAAGIIVDRLAGIYVNDPVIRTIAAQYFLFRDDKVRTQFHSRILIRLAPEAVISHMIMGRAFLAQHNGKAAEHHFRMALALPVPRGPKVEVREIEGHLAIALREQGLFDEARVLFERVVEGSQDVALLLAWASLEEHAKNFAAATELLRQAEAIAPKHPPIAVARAALMRRMKLPEQALALLNADPEEKGDHAVGILLQKGQALDAMGRYDEAFSAFTSCKQRLREISGKSYLADHAVKLVTSLKDFFTEGRSHLFPRAGVRENQSQPIFIVGFPRSGTTLVEQILSSHSQVAAGDELPIIGNICDRMPQILGSVLTYPQALSELWLGDRAGHIDSLRDLYLNEAMRFGALDPSKRWFTDKMPLNETHLGLIHLLFPKSPIIHLVRHPLDVVLSVFSNGLNHGYFCAYALESAAQHYALIADLIAHYRTALSLHYHAVRYEDLVASQESEIRKLLDFIEEPFDAATLHFHENARPARTASYAQVTEKLYTSSVYRYRGYLKHLEPVIPILAPAIERLGYSIDL